MGTMACYFIGRVVPSIMFALLVLTGTLVVLDSHPLGPVGAILWDMALTADAGTSGYSNSSYNLTNGSATTATGFSFQSSSVVTAQTLVSLALFMFYVRLSLGSVHRTAKVCHSYNCTWIFAVVFLLFCHILLYLSSVAMLNAARMPWWIGLTVALWEMFVMVVVDEAFKHKDRQQYKLYCLGLRQEFETKLGQYSPF